MNRRMDGTPVQLTTKLQKDLRQKSAVRAAVLHHSRAEPRSHRSCCLPWGSRYINCGYIWFKDIQRSGLVWFSWIELAQIQELLSCCCDLEESSWETTVWNLKIDQQGMLITQHPRCHHQGAQQQQGVKPKTLPTARSQLIPKRNLREVKGKQHIFKQTPLLGHVNPLYRSIKIKWIEDKPCFFSPGFWILIVLEKAMKHNQLYIYLFWNCVYGLKELKWLSTLANMLVSVESIEYNDPLLHS